MLTAVMIPQFKNTEDALQFGHQVRGNQDVIEALRSSREAHLIAVQILNRLGQEDVAFYLASGQSQLVREALEAATK